MRVGRQYLRDCCLHAVRRLSKCPAPRCFWRAGAMWIWSCRQKLIGNDGQASRDVPIVLTLSDGEPPQQPEVFQRDPMFEIAGSGTPILPRVAGSNPAPATK